MSYIVNAYVDEMMSIKYKVAYYVNNLCQQFCSGSLQHHYICKQVRYQNRDILAYHVPPRIRQSTALPGHKLSEASSIPDVKLHSATVHQQGNETLHKSKTESVYCNASVLEHSIPMTTCPIVCHTEFCVMSINPHSTVTEKSIADESITISLCTSQEFSEIDSIVMSPMLTQSSTCISYYDTILVEVCSSVELIIGVSAQSHGDSTTNYSCVHDERQPVQSIISHLPAIYNQLKHSQELSSRGQIILVNDTSSALLYTSLNEDKSYYTRLLNHMTLALHFVISLLLPISVMPYYQMVITVRKQSKMFDPGITNVVY